MKLKYREARLFAQYWLKWHRRSGPAPRPPLLERTLMAVPQNTAKSMKNTHFLLFSVKTGT
jgi:hypothetical protein